MKTKNLNIETITVQNKQHGVYKISFFKITDWSKNAINNNNNAPNPNLLIKRLQSDESSNLYDLISFIELVGPGYDYIKVYSGSPYPEIIDEIEEWCYVYIVKIEILVKGKKYNYGI